MLTALLVGSAAFLSTNLDDLVVLLALWTDPNSQRREVLLGQLVATTVLVGSALVVCSVAIVIPERWLALTGVLPIAVGAKRIWDRKADEEDDDQAPSRRFGWLAVMLVTLANGADNIAVYSALFVRKTVWTLLALTLLFLVLTVLWCEATRLIARHPKVIHRLQRLGDRGVPWILILIGIYLLVSKGLLGQT